MRVMPWTMAIFLLYVIVAALVIISLFSGVMSEHMNTVREQEQIDEQKRQQEEMVGALKIMHKAFKAADVAGDHLITKAEFEAMAKRPELRDELASVGVDLEEVEPGELFDCFDEGGRGVLSWDEFNAGMEGLREGASPKQFFKLLAAVWRAIYWDGRAPAQPRHQEAVEKELALANNGLARAERCLEGLRSELTAFLEEPEVSKH
mmetsp:Transcript_18730/g.25202  ORF Transcript_18730/g.25202 Transcript_18730/m.25202 type:complete len:206 (+) Transcript_18730:2-619(+)